MLYLPPPWKKVADMDNKKSSAVKDLLLGKVIYTIKDIPLGKELYNQGILLGNGVYTFKDILLGKVFYTVKDILLGKVIIQSTYSARNCIYSNSQ
jgi:hypothetical protein